VTERVVAIHQPNFFPWLGYFDKIRRCDVFVVLDAVQYPKTGGTWMNRVGLSVAGRKAWLTAPIVRSSGVWSVAETEFQPTPWRETVRKTILANYARAPRFREVRDFLFELVDHPVNDLVEYNLHAIASICARIGIDFPARCVRQSTLGTERASTDLLVEIVRKVGGTAYLCGGGASGYQEDWKFREAGLRLVSQEFRHPVYAQGPSSGFIPGLSIVDAFMNAGFDGVRRLLSGEAP